jgi:hypothetical protein
VVPGRPDHLGYQRAHRCGLRAAPVRRRRAGEQFVSVQPQAGSCLRGARRQQSAAAAPCPLLRWEKLYEGRPAWIGAATFDERVGLSHTTGQVTHHIGPDVDAERDRIASELQKAGLVDTIDWDNDFHPRREGRNGGGDPWHTDGRLAIVVLRGSAEDAGG